MEEKIKSLLVEEIKTSIENLSTLEPGSKEKSAAIDDLIKLYKLKIEETKSESDLLEKRDEAINRRLEQELKEIQHEEQVKERYLRLGVEAAGIILPLIFYATWMGKGFKFEETGTYTSTTFRGLFNRFKPTK